MSGSFHEQFERAEAALPSDRSTGLVFTAIAAIIAFVWRSNSIVLTIALAVAAVLAIISLTMPSFLRPLNVAWMRFAMLLGKIVNPVVLLILFAAVIVPAGLIMQRVRDPLRRQKEQGKTYWIAIGDADRSISNMKNQF